MQRPSILKPMLILASAAVLLVAMRLAASFLLPVLLSAFFATLLSPIYGWLKQRVAPGLALLLSIGFMLLVAVFLLLLVGSSFNTLAASLSTYTEQFSQRQTEFAAQVESLNLPNSLSAALPIADPNTLTGVLSAFVDSIAGLVKNSLVILMETIFILAEGPLFIRRMRQTFGAEHPLPQGTVTLAKSTISYFALRALVNLVTASATGLMLWFFGIEYAGLWAVLSFFLSFVPYVGAFVATIPPLLIAYAQGGLAFTALIGLLCVVINSTTENIIAPMVMGKGLSISPTVVFISFIFWMLILGGSGAILSIPLTMAVILFLRNFEETRGIAAILEIPPAPVPQAKPSSDKILSDR